MIIGGINYWKIKLQHQKPGLSKGHCSLHVVTLKFSTVASETGILVNF